MFFVVFFVLGLGGTHACCAPERWECTAMNLNSPETDMVYFQVAHDDVFKFEGVVKLDSTMRRVIKHYIKDFNRMFMYTIEPEANPPTCIKSTLLEPFISKADCERGRIPGATNMQSYGSKTLGLAPSSVDMEVTSFEINRMKIWRGMAEANNMCFPIFHRIQFLDHDINHALIAFNPTDHVRYPMMFVIPSYC